MKPTTIIILSLLVLTFGVYLQVHNYQFVNFDDRTTIVNNPHIREGLSMDGLKWAFTSAYAANWFPVTWISHMADVQFYGFDSGSHHLTNVLIHLATTLLVFFFFWRFTGRMFWESAFISFVFALHPQHVESVAWVTERKDVLSAFFWFLTMWFYLDYVEKPSRFRYALTLAALALGLMSKQMLVTLPFVLLMMDYWPLKRAKTILTSRLLLEKTPYLIMSAAASFIVYKVQHDSGTVVSIYLPLGTRISNALISYVEYIRQFLVPTGLAAFYPYNLSLHFPLWQVAGAALLLIAVSVFSLKRQYLTFGWMWFLGTLVPVIGFVQVGLQARADRYVYIPSIGLAIMLIFGVAEMIGHWPKARWWIEGALAAVCVAWVAITWTQIQYWQNTNTLFEHAIATTENNYLAHLNLGVVQVEQGKTKEALKNLYAAVEENPDMMDAHDTLGALLAQMGQSKEAEGHFRKAIQLQPNDTEAHFNLGNALLDMGRLPQAAEEFRIALRLEPNLALAHFGLGATLLNLGKVDESIAEFSEALRLDPTLGPAREGLQKALSVKKELAGR